MYDQVISSEKDIVSTPNGKRKKWIIFFVLVFFVVIGFFFLIKNQYNRLNNSQVSDIEEVFKTGLFSINHESSYGNMIIWSAVSDGNLSGNAYDISKNIKYDLSKANFGYDQIVLSLYNREVITVEISPDKKIAEYYIHNLDDNSNLKLNIGSDNFSKSIYLKPEYFPKVSFFDKTIVFLNKDNKIIALNIDSSENTVVSDCHSPANCKPVISGNKIAWIDEEDGYSIITVYNLESGKSTEVSRLLGLGKDDLFFNQNTLLWVDNRNCRHNIEACGGEDIYTYDLLNQKEQRVTSLAYNYSSPFANNYGVFWSLEKGSTTDLGTMFSEIILNKKTKDKRDIYTKKTSGNRVYLLFSGVGTSPSYSNVIGADEKYVVWKESNYQQNKDIVYRGLLPN